MQSSCAYTTNQACSRQYLVVGDASLLREVGVEAREHDPENASRGDPPEFDEMERMIIAKLTRGLTDAYLTVDSDSETHLVSRYTVDAASFGSQADRAGQRAEPIFPHKMGV